jgi:hypothetical protein
MLLLHVEILVSAPNANREDVFVAPFRGKWHSPAAKKQERLAVAFILSGSKIVCRRHCELSRSDW